MLVVVDLACYTWLGGDITCYPPVLEKNWPEA